MKIVLYTCITGGYDRLNEIHPQHPGVDLVCFTDDLGLRYGVSRWNVVPIPGELSGLRPVKQQRLVKILPHKFLSGYDVSVWVDGNVAVKGDIVKFLGGIRLSEKSFWTRRHPSRKCAYREAEAVLRVGKDVSGKVGPQMERYRKEGFPEGFGLEETGIIVRTQKDPKCQILCNLWGKEVLENSHRDQLSLDYCRWKTGTEIGVLDFDMRRNPWFSLKRHVS